MEKDLRKLSGLGPKSLQRLAEMGITSLEDLASRPVDADSQGWAFFSKRDEWKRLVLQARAILLHKHIEPGMVEVLPDSVKLKTKDQLAQKIFITNVLEVSERVVKVDESSPDFTIIGPKDTGNPQNDAYYKRLFSDALLRVPEKVGGIKKHTAFSLDSEQGVNELQYIMQMQRAYDNYLADLVSSRLEETVQYGKDLKLADLVDYLQSLSSNLYFDSFLSLVQQYSLCDAPIVSNGVRKMSTGFNLALFGQPGTGKTFATVDLVVGNENDGIPAHGLPGINRYCGGMTVAQFVRIAQAYQGRKFNFIVTEFNDWFKYPGMVENLKQALERKQLKYETVNETIGPYSFDSFFSVNYNTQVHQRGYEVTINDPNFNAIEDRMITRLHRMTKARFINILDSMKGHLLSETEYDAQKIRDHLVLVYGIQTGHPLVAQHFERKDVELTHEVVNTVTDAAKTFVENLSTENVAFSPRLVKRTISLCCAMSVMKYFSSPKLVPDAEMMDYGVQFFCQEASVRSQESVNPDAVYLKIKSKVLKNE